VLIHVPEGGEDSSKKENNPETKVRFLSTQYLDYYKHLKNQLAGFMQDLVGFPRVLLGAAARFPALDREWLFLAGGNCTRSSDRLSASPESKLDLPEVRCCLACRAFYFRAGMVLKQQS